MDDFERGMRFPQEKEAWADDRSTLPADSKKIQIFHGLKHKKIKCSRNWILLPSGRGAMLKPEEALHEYQQDINQFMQGYALGHVSAVLLRIAHDRPAPSGSALGQELELFLTALSFSCLIQWGNFWGDAANIFRESA